MASFLLSERFCRLFKEGTWVIAGQCLAIFGSLLGVRVLTGLLAPQAYGELALGMTLATLVQQVLLGPLGNGAIRFYAAALQQNDLSGYLAAVGRMVWWATLLIGLMTVGAVTALFVIGQTKWIAMAVGALIFASLTGYNSILNGIQNAARQRSVVALHQGLESWMRFLLPAGLILCLGSTSVVAMLGNAVAVVFVLGSQYVFFCKILPQKVAGPGNEKVWRQQMWAYAWPMAVTGIVSWASFASQRWALELFTTTKEVGYFSAVFQVGFTPFSLVGGILMAFLMPIIFSRVGDGEDRQKVKRVSTAIVKFCLAAFLLVLLMTAVGHIFHEQIFHLLIGKQYQNVSYYLPLAILAGGLFQISLMLSTIILVSKETRILLPVNVVGNALIVAINFISSYLYGMGGLFWGIVLGFAIHCGWNVFNVYSIAWKVQASFVDPEKIETAQGEM